MAVLAWNSKGDVTDLWYNNYECASALVAELLGIQKAFFLVFINFPTCYTQVENDHEIAVKILIGVIPCPLRALIVFECIKNLISHFKDVDLMWCLRNYNERTHEMIKWLGQIIISEAGYMIDILSNIEIIVI